MEQKSMTPEQFCYWLQGFVEIKEDDTPPSMIEWVRITDHLQLVFKKETPQFPMLNPPSLFPNGIPPITC